MTNVLTKTRKHVSFSEVLFIIFDIMDKIESYFKFEITQTVAVLFYKVRMGDGKRWWLEKIDGGYVLHQLYPEGKEKQDNQSKVELRGEHTMVITTVRGFVYTIVDKEPDGAEVSYHGPLNSILMQSLMPRMTYVPKTLVGMNNLMDDYVPIDEFMALRAERHGNEPNPRDAKSQVNRVFYNEIPGLPKFKTGRVRKFDTRHKRKR